MSNAAKGNTERIQSINWASIRREVELAKTRLNYKETFARRNAPPAPVSEELRGTIFDSRT